MFLYAPNNLVLVANNEKSWYIDNLKPHYYCKCTVYSLLSQGDGSLHAVHDSGMCQSVKAQSVYSRKAAFSSRNLTQFSLVLVASSVREGAIQRLHCSTGKYRNERRRKSKSKLDGWWIARRKSANQKRGK